MPATSPLHGAVSQPLLLSNHFSNFQDVDRDDIANQQAICHSIRWRTLGPHHLRAQGGPRQSHEPRGERSRTVCRSIFLQAGTPNLTILGIYKPDKQLRRYAVGIERALASWEANPQEWADYIAFLGRLLKVCFDSLR